MRTLLILLASAILANSAAAATLTVRKDGTGNYTVIQDALDHAAAGDTIRIGPGSFEDPTTIALPGFTYPVVSYAVVRVPVLTIIGSGVYQTEISPTSFAGGGLPNTPQGITCDLANAQLTIRDLTVGRCEVGLWVKGTLDMDNCRIEDTNLAMYWLPSGGGGHLRNTTVYNRWSSAGGMVIGNGTPLAGGVVENCVISGLNVHGVQGLQVRDCELGSALFMLGASVDLVRCSTSAAGYGIIQMAGTGAYCGIDDCIIRGSDSALTVDPSAPGARFVVSNSRLEGGSRAILWARSGSGPCVIHGSDLVKGSGAAVLCDVSTTSVVHDLTNNWWGTSSATDVASWIVDHADDPNIGATVLFTPFADLSVPTESTSWGDLKALYR